MSMVKFINAGIIYVSQFNCQSEVTPRIVINIISDEDGYEVRTMTDGRIERSFPEYGIGGFVEDSYWSRLSLEGDNGFLAGVMWGRNGLARR